MSITNINLNLLPPDLRPRRVIHWVPIYTVTIIVALVVFVALNLLTTLWSLKSLNEKIVQDNKSKDSLTSAVQEFDYLSSVKNALEKRQLVFLYVQNGYIDWVTFIRELEGKIPRGVWLSDITTDKFPRASHAGHVNIRGKTSDNLLLSVAQFVENLEGSPYFSNVTFVRSTSLTQGATSVQEFAISLEFTPPSVQVPLPGVQAQTTSKPATTAEPKPGGAPQAKPGGGKT